MALSSTMWTFTGLRYVHLGDQQESDLGGGFSLIKPNASLLSARDHHFMSNEEYDDAENCGSYLVFKRSQDILEDDQSALCRQELQNGMVAIQIVKPTDGLGFIFQCEQWNGSLSLKSAERRPSITTGQWARMRIFDNDLRAQVPSMIIRVQNVMSAANAEPKNALILLQLALEHMHPLIAGLLNVMGMEAIFDSGNRTDFRDKLCDCLGASTLAFPDWNSPTMPQPKYTVGELAIPIYMLRNKLAHGADLRKASLDKTTPVDLVKKVKLIPVLEPRAHAYLLAEAAGYLHCKVLQRVL
jgi:hypothetical protein